MACRLAGWPWPGPGCLPQWTQGFAPSPRIYHDTAMRMADLLALYHEDYFAVKMFKKFAPYFCANFKFSQSILKQLMKADTVDQLKDKIHHLLSEPPQLLGAPNINLFV